jgi:tetrapyrrole methylase family protein / MazG family protein
MSEPQPPIMRLREIMAHLRSPEGCPWDREQTHATLKKELIEETYEVVEAIDANSPDHLEEELGDLLLQIVFHAQMADEAGHFNFDDVAAGISDKLVRRHPHVFGDAEAPDSDAVLKNWHKIKSEEKPERTGIFAGVTKSLPALMLAMAVQKKAAQVGFDWPDTDGPLGKVREETDELAADLKDRKKAEEELGDLLFAVVNLSRKLKLDAEQCLLGATRKFQQRFEQVEARIKVQGKKLEDCSLEEMDKVWNEIKARKV